MAAKVKYTTVIGLAGEGDVPSIKVSGDLQGAVTLGINDNDSDDSADGRALITGIATRYQAVKLACAILTAAGFEVTNRFEQGAVVATID